VPIDCAHADLQADEGRVTLKTFVVDTSDTLFTVSGTFNLAEETLDLTVYPQPKDVSLFSSRSALHVAGTFNAPELYPDALSLTSRGAAAPGLGLLAGPGQRVLSGIGGSDEKGAPANQTGGHSMIRRYMLIFLTTLVLSGCAVMQPAEDARPDKALAARVKAALIQDPQIDAVAIGVTADGRHVRLDGFVETEDEHRQAERTALKIEGVVDVVNKIEVK
jgi:hypothetical protein